MDELLPFDAYDEAGRWPTVIAMRLVGVVIGVPLALVLWLFGIGDGNPVVLVVACIAAGAAFGWLWSRWLRRAITALSERLYAADPEFVPSPPTGDYRFRVMSALMRGDTATRGHLYVSPSRWVFVPAHIVLRHEKRPVAPEPPVDLGPAPVVVVPDTRPGRPRRAIRRSPFMVRVDSPAGPFLLKVPQPDVVVARLMELSAEGVEVSRGS